jgi:hypothetical protein
MERIHEIVPRLAYLEVAEGYNTAIWNMVPPIDMLDHLAEPPPATISRIRKLAIQRLL